MVNGALQVVDNPGVMGASCAIGASGIYDLIRHPYTVAVDADLQDGEMAFISITNLRNTIASFQVMDGNLIAATLGKDGSTNPNQTAYLPADHHYWRLEGVPNDHDGVDLVWSTSANGRDFAFFAKATDFTGLDRVFLDVGLNGYQTPGSLVRFDNVNVAP